MRTAHGRELGQPSKISSRKPWFVRSAFESNVIELVKGGHAESFRRGDSASWKKIRELDTFDWLVGKKLKGCSVLG